MKICKGRARPKHAKTILDIVEHEVHSGLAGVDAKLSSLQSMLTQMSIMEQQVLNYAECPQKGGTCYRFGG